MGRKQRSEPDGISRGEQSRWKEQLVKRPGGECRPIRLLEQEGASVAGGDRVLGSPGSDWVGPCG